MKYKKVLLVAIEYKGSNYGASFPPVGLGYISKILHDNDIAYEVMDMRLGYNKRHLRKQVQEFNPDLIGISMMTFRYKEGYQLIKEVKEEFNKDIVVGGPHISLVRNEALEECTHIDYGVVREGEETILELCRGKDLNEIPGLIHRKDGKVIFNSDRPLNVQLDSYSFPTYQGFELNKYVTRSIPLVTSRGCPYACIFCGAGLAIGKKWRMRSSEHVLEELVYWYKMGYRNFDVLDDNFVMDLSRIYEICSGIEKRGLKKISLMAKGIRADRVDEPVLKRLKQVGFREIAIGVESGNDRILKILKKGESLSKIENTIKIACNLGYRVSLEMVIGTPGETWSDIEDSVNLVLKYPVRDVSFANLIPYPNTELYNWIKKNNCFVIDPEIYLNKLAAEDIPVFQTPELSVEMRKKALNYTKKIRNEVNKRYIKGKLKRFGMLGDIAAKIFVLDSTRMLLKKNRVFRRTIEGTFNLLTN